MRARQHSHTVCAIFICAACSFSGALNESGDARRTPKSANTKPVSSSTQPLNLSLVQRRRILEERRAHLKLFGGQCYFRPVRKRESATARARSDATVYLNKSLSFISHFVFEAVDVGTCSWRNSLCALMNAPGLKTWWFAYLLALVGFKCSLCGLHTLNYFKLFATLRCEVKNDHKSRFKSEQMEQFKYPTSQLLNQQYNFIVK